MESVEFERQQRTAGDTSWNYWKLWNFALDGITSFSTMPLRLWLYVGGIVSLLSFLLPRGFISSHSNIFDHRRRRTRFIHLLNGRDLCFLAASSFFPLAALLSGEYVGRILNETKARPIYIIDAIE